MAPYMWLTPTQPKPASGLTQNMDNSSFDIQKTFSFIFFGLSYLAISV